MTMGAAKTFTETDFQGAMAKDGIFFVDFWATWCGPCRTFAPVYEEVAAENPDIVFAKVDTDAEQRLAGAFHIQSIPTLMIVRDRVILFSQPGAVPKGALQALVKQVRGLDMEQVRKEIAEQERGHATGQHSNGQDHAEASEAAAAGDANGEAAGESEA